MQLKLSDIRKDGGTQPRASYHFGAAESYAEDMLAGAIFPPVVVFYDGSDYWLADGFHRIFAAEKIGYETIETEVRQGTLEDAQWYSYSVNQAHGLRRSNEDKRRAVEAALKHPKAAGMSDEAVAQHCGVSRKMVNEYRQLVTKLQVDQPSVRTGRDGRTRNTANIGKSKRTPKPQTTKQEPSEDKQPATPPPPPKPTDPEEAFDAMLAQFSVGVRQLCRDITGDDLPEETIQRMIDVFSQAIADRVEV